MREIVITVRDEAQRLDRFLEKYLKLAPKSFIYRMLRKKNITLQGKKATGSEKLKAGDTVRLWLGEDTIEGFLAPEIKKQSYPKKRLDIIYEDEDILLVNKPAGMLSQKAAPEDVSLCEYLIGYLLSEGKITEKDLRSFRPSVCSRLDRNTSGIVCCGKTIAGLQFLSAQLRERLADKKYTAIVTGIIDEEAYQKAYLEKNSARNKVRIFYESGPSRQLIETAYRPVLSGRISAGNKEPALPATCIEVKLLTGRSHQIRAQMAAVSHPLLGDTKYGDAAVNAMLLREYGIRFQMLCCSSLSFGETDGKFAYLSGQSFKAELPGGFNRIMDELRKS